MTEQENIAIGRFLRAAQSLIERTPESDLAATDEWLELARAMEEVAVMKSAARSTR